MKKIIFQEKAKIISNKRTGEGYFHLVIAAKQIAQEAQPGQFINIKVSSAEGPLLRRPISIHRIAKGQVRLLYEVLGTGTQILSHRKSGECLDVIGPLGNGFVLRPTTDDLRPHILVAGGMGVAPLVFLAEKLKGCKTLILIGAKTKKHILCEKEFKQLGCEVKIATDDGSCGFKGKVTDLLGETLRPTTYDLRPTMYACGPRPMLKAISSISKEHNLPTWVSLEEHMACGIGACLGCVVNTVDGYKRVCQDGPVFSADEIIWGGE